MNQSLQSLVNALIPLEQIAQICNAVYVWFALVGFFLLCIGYMMAVARGGDEGVQHALGRMIILAAAIAAAPWFLTLTQDIVNGLVNAIGQQAGGSWEVTPNASNTQLTMDWTGPYKQLGTFVTGNFPQSSGGNWWEPEKLATYVIQEFLILVAALVAGVTIIIMQLVLIVQKLIILMSGPIMPLAIGALFIPAARDAGQNILKGIVAVISWPIGWGIGSIGWMAALKLLQSPVWGANPGSVVVALVPFLLLCLWIVLSVIGAPAIITGAVVYGTDAVATLVSRTAAIGASQAAGVAAAGGSIVGAGVGARWGAGGVDTGARIGSALGAPFSAAASSIQQFEGGKQFGATDLSRAYADRAIAAIRQKAKG